MQKQKVGFTPLFLIFLVCTQQAGWQGYGNWSTSNLTEIWTFINGNIHTYTSNDDYDTFTKALSNKLNTLWDPFWNCVTIKTTAIFDTVVYAYAYNNHWLWYNDYEVDGKVLTFVIWKDYNCETPMMLGKNGPAANFDDPSVMQSITTTNMFYEKEDLWNGCVALENVYSSYLGGAHSVIGSQDDDSDFYAWVCGKGGYFYYTKKDLSSGMRPFISSMASSRWGNALIFTNRFNV